MASKAKAKLSLVFLLFSLVLLLSNLALATHDPERRDDEGNPEGPKRRLKECMRQCDRREGQEQPSCRRQCRERYQREREEQEHGGRGRGEERESNDSDEGSEREQEQGQQESGHPYLFEDQHFTARARSQHGRLRVLQKFTERSNLLRGIENYRLSILEADPQILVIPNHLDAERLLFVARGRGTISLVHQDRRESFNLQRGDVLRVPAGTTSYMINRDNNEKLVIAKLLQPVGVPGEFQPFFGPGGEDPESFYRAFSTEILESALNTRRDKLQRLFGQQRQGIIIKASEEQIRSMSHREEGGRSWPFGGESRGPFNLLNKRPSQSNQYGQLHEVDARDYRQLQDLDVAISFANITQGSMEAPFYNSRATKISVVVEGEGYFEMACPHLSSSESGGQGKSSPSYRRVSGRLRRGTVLVVPAGHPIVRVASSNQNLELLCFEINARDNEKYPLAGRRNIMNQLEKEAKELAFGVPAREVEEIFRQQEEDFFFRGPGQQQQEGGRGDA
ncbi:hypothetical protein F0562_021237 [Nyssa sinensis]|uniref:Cupin type-1 domain-containing protein n=1 Tax=Nyssa sinensis TaxID=561372 RepID=A0A5J5BKU9_9ASTE|nr:hypothetical protein F0562_021237 [Nyssa sinensis]